MTRTKMGPIPLAWGAAMLLAAPLTGQTGAITGRVIDETGQPLAAAEVRVISGGTRAASALASSSGEFRLSVAAGSYDIQVTAIGFETESVTGVSLAAGETRTLEITLRSRSFLLGGIVVSVRGTPEKALDAPANVTVVGREAIRERVAVTPVDHLKALPGVDIAQTGVSQSNVVTRGFNNVFSGAMLVITDNRYASVPSLRLNAFNMIPLTNFDSDRMEVLLGPASALYGPNSANGVLHIITKSPIDEPGTSVSMAGGERSLFQGQLRHATRVSDRLGVKLSGQYFRANDWQLEDSLDVLARDFGSERFGGEARVDVRPWESGELILSAGLNQLGSSIELTPIGGAQARDWRYTYVQSRLRSGRFFAQAFLNQSDAGETVLLRTGQPILDNSRMMVGQLQHGLGIGSRLDVIYGADLQRSEPRTQGTITGRNEDDDHLDEVGGYVHAKLALGSRVDLVGALRADHHNRLEDVVFSPRAALLFRPASSQTLRLTFNRAFSTPTTNNLFLDLSGGTLPIPRPFNYGVRTRGVPSTGFTFDERCEGGLRQHCMVSPLNPGSRMASNAALFWDPLVQALVPAELRAFLSNPGRPGDPALASMFRRFSPEARGFVEDAGPENITRLRPTITNTLEVGYKGMARDRLVVSADVYRSAIRDFVGPLGVETPSVFLTPASVQAFVSHRLGPLIAAGAVTSAQARQIIEGFAQLPIGTVVPDQEMSTDLILTYRNFGDVNLWGTDVAFQLLATRRLSFTGSASFVSEDCFDFDGDERCTSSADVSLNAPSWKGSAGARWSDDARGYSLDGFVRFADAFPLNSGVYVGDVESHTVVDANTSYRIPGIDGATASVTVTNLLNTKHRHFIGAPELGRLALLRLAYSF